MQGFKCVQRIVSVLALSQADCKISAKDLAMATEEGIQEENMEKKELANIESTAEQPQRLAVTTGSASLNKSRSANTSATLPQQQQQRHQRHQQQLHKLHKLNKSRPANTSATLPQQQQHRQHNESSAGGRANSTHAKNKEATSSKSEATVKVHLTLRSQRSHHLSIQHIQQRHHHPCCCP